MRADYREKIYARYGRNFQDATEHFDAASSVRWGRSYRHYLRGWLPDNRNSDIADLACGGGRLLHFLKEKGYRTITGVDLSAAQVALSKQVVSTVIQSDVLLYLDSSTVRFDLLIALDLVEHLYKQEVIDFLERCFAAIK